MPWRSTVVPNTLISLPASGSSYYVFRRYAPSLPPSLNSSSSSDWWERRPLRLSSETCSSPGLLSTGRTWVVCDRRLWARIPPLLQGTCPPQGLHMSSHPPPIPSPLPPIPSPTSPMASPQRILTPRLYLLSSCQLWVEHFGDEPHNHCHLIPPTHTHRPHHPHPSHRAPIHIVPELTSRPQRYLEGVRRRSPRVQPKGSSSRPYYINPTRVWITWQDYSGFGTPGGGTIRWS